MSRPNRDLTRNNIMDALMDIEAAQTPHRRGATAKQIAARASISIWRVLAELHVLVESRHLIEIVGKTGATKPTNVYRMRRTRKVAA